MTLKIYGTAASRAARALWVAQELGLVYEHIPVPYLGGATRTPEFLAINPNGRIPVLDDDGVRVWESMACALYLAERFKLAPCPQVAAWLGRCLARPAFQAVQLLALKPQPGRG